MANADTFSNKVRDATKRFLRSKTRPQMFMSVLFELQRKFPNADVHDLRSELKEIFKDAKKEEGPFRLTRYELLKLT